MSKTESILDVYISGQLCGYLTEHRYGMITFEYDRGYQGVPLSLSMPLSLARYDDRIVRPFLMGLLPDEPSTRTAIGAHQGISGNNPFRLLSIIGLDCPGAVQVCAHQVAPSSPNNAAGFIEATESDMEAKLASVKQNAATAWTYGSETEGHWSLAGCQAKFAMRLKGDRWYECTGSAATTHIVKPGVVGFDNQALVEYLSMKAAKAVGLPVANVAYRTFGSEPAIVIERYDRVETPAGEVVRIHQEDFCQAMSVSPETKYAEQGGPSTPQIIEMLKTTGSNARDNIYRFILFMFFNYLIGATDAHAKNHSILFVAPDDIRLAPLYDVATIAPYRNLVPERRKPLRAALSIGGENRFGRLKPENIQKMVDNCDLDNWEINARFLQDRFVAMAELIPDALESVLGEAEALCLPGIDEVAPPIRKEIGNNCRRSLDAMS